MTQEMTFLEARSHAQKQLNSLRAFERVEAVLAAAARAERATVEAVAARDKAQAEKATLRDAIRELGLKHDAAVKRDADRANTAAADVLKAEATVKHNYAAVLKSQKEDLAARLKAGATKIDYLHGQIVKRTEELAALDTQVAAANAALEALKTGLAGIK